MLATAFLAACDTPRSPEHFVFVDGRAVAATSDTALLLTLQGTPGVVRLDPRTGVTDTMGSTALHSPHHIQRHAARIFVSDVEGGQASIVELSNDGELEQRIALHDVASGPHQFAVLPEGRIVVEAPDDRLVILGDSLTTFAITGRAARTGLVVAALGGVLHALPERAVTLYNGNGNIRWRLPWPWGQGIYVTDLAVDAQGRMHALAGDGEKTFRVFTFDQVTGEIIRWSLPGSSATFVVNRLGAIAPDSAGRGF